LTKKSKRESKSFPSDNPVSGAAPREKERERVIVQGYHKNTNYNARKLMHHIPIHCDSPSPLPLSLHSHLLPLLNYKYVATTTS